MALERRNPLPIGKYWVDVPEDKESSFRDWLSDNKDSVAVENEDQHTSYEGDTALFTDTVYWFLFTVNTPVNWNGPGLPTIATTDVKNQSDTVVKPDTPTPLEEIEEAAKKAADTAKTVAWTVGGLILLAIGYNLTKK